MGLEQPVRFRPDLDIPMRDGTVLRADLYRPESEGPLPVVLARTPYNKQLADPARPWLRFASAGYAVVVQDCRGCCASDGEFVPFRDEPADGYDTIEWIAGQPWSTGKIGMFGTSYLGATQWLAASAAPPHLTTIVPTFTASDYHDGWIYQSGAFLLSFALGWALPFALRDISRRNLPAHQAAHARERLLAAMTDIDRTRAHRPLTDAAPFAEYGLAGYYAEWLAHADDDAYWRQWRISDLHERITVPVLSMTGWYDMFMAGTIGNYLGMRRNGGSATARKNQRLVLGPWAHGKPLFGGNPDPQFDFGPFSAGSAIDVDGIALRWFDHWLRGIDNGVLDEAPAKVFTLGTNRWRDLSEWPPPSHDLDLYLHSGGAANSSQGDGSLSTEPGGDETPDVFVYDPNRPVPTHGGRAFMNDGARDQRLIEQRADVLVYSSAPLSEEIEVTGHVSLTLWAATSAADTDFTAKLVDVFPDGRVMNLADNIIRARYRESLVRATPIAPGRAYEYRIDLSAISVVFAAGHQIGVEISSSNFPRFDANPNTGAPCAGESHAVSATQTIYHDGSHPSRITLPVIKR